MNSISEEIIKNLNNRLLTQAVIIESLCDLMVSSGLITEEELENKIEKNIDIHQKFIDEKISDIKKFSNLNLMGFNFGPIGEC
jgi:NurA-like 5'-3' nuclease